MLSRPLGLRSSSYTASGAMDNAKATLFSDTLTMEQRFGPKAKQGGRWVVQKIFEAYEARNLLMTCSQFLAAEYLTERRLHWHPVVACFLCMQEG